MRDKRGYSSAGRAPALQAGGQRFDPAYLHHEVDMGPQLSWLERTTDNRKVGGSSPLGPTTSFENGYKRSDSDGLYLLSTESGICTLKTEQRKKSKKARQQISGNTQKKHRKMWKTF